MLLEVLPSLQQHLNLGWLLCWCREQAAQARLERTAAKRRTPRQRLRGDGFNVLRDVQEGADHRVGVRETKGRAVKEVKLFFPKAMIFLLWVFMLSTLIWVNTRVSLQPTSRGSWLQ
jgi:hypothetical protein